MLVPLLAFTGEIGRIAFIEVWDENAVIFSVSDAGIIIGENGRYIGKLTESERAKMEKTVAVYTGVAKKIKELGE